MSVATCGVVALGVSVRASAAENQGTNRQADKALAHLELLSPSSYPKGWQGQGPKSTDPQTSFWAGDSASEVRQMSSCLGIGTSHVDTNPAEADAQTYFDNNSGNSVVDTVDVFPSTAFAVADVADAANAKFPDCLTTLLGPDIISGTLQSFGKGAKAVGKLVITHQTIPPTGGTDSYVQFALPVSYQGITGTFYSDFIAIQKGRSESTLLFQNQGIKPPASIIDCLVKDAAARMKSN